MTQPLRDTGESILFSLRSLYGQHGYSHYKMNKFEEYDLYAHNKDFLISDSVITFTDGNGKLLALKPDVTLSIVKNSRDRSDVLQKLYYNENVYRMSKGSRNFKEIMQVGLECIGKVDDYCVYEVLKLAQKSLDVISRNNVLSVSHLGILSEVMDNIGVPGGSKAEVLHLIGEKNLHELGSLLGKLGVCEGSIDLLRRLLSIRGLTDEVLLKTGELLCGVVSDDTMAHFTSVLSALSSEKNLSIDFSVVGDINYYNGFVFKGFVEGIPTSLLSGGQYDMLMRKMGRSSEAIGFAVYLDMIEQYIRKPEKYDVDVVLLYDSTSSLSQIGEEVQRLTEGGESVLSASVLPLQVKYRKLLKMQNGRVDIVETNA